MVVNSCTDAQHEQGIYLHCSVLYTSNTCEGGAIPHLSYYLKEEIVSLFQREKAKEETFIQRRNFQETRK